MKHLPGIDGLRAVAVLSVVAYHAGLPVPAGFVGVDVFFVISGYLITSLLAKELAASGRIDLLAFYARRVRRIVPALVVMVAATVAASALLLTTQGIADVSHSAIAALGVFANIHFMNATGGYFDQASADMPLLHTWSLSVEEQFYFIWPLVLLLRRKWLLPVLAVASLVIAEGLQHVTPEAAFYQMPARFWELGVGGMIAYAAPRQIRWLAPAGLALLAVAIAYPLPSFPGVGALPAVLGAAAVIHAVHSGASVPLLESRPARLVGLLSYSLYLWHWPVLVLWRLTHLDAPTLPITGALVAGSFLLAWLSYRYVETPARKQWPHLSQHRVVASGLAACIAVILVAVPMAHKADATALEEETFYSAVPNVAPTVAVWGDSHAAAWMPLGGAIAHKEQRGLVGWTTIICPPTLGYTMRTVETDRFPKQPEACQRQNEKAVRELSQGGFDTVVMAARWLPLFQQLPGIDSPYPTDAATVAAMEAGLARSVDAIAPHVRRIIIMGPVAQLKAQPDRCITTHTNCSMSRAEFVALSAKPLAYMRSLAAKHPNVEVVDVTDFLCDANQCPSRASGVTMYRDDDHLSTAAAQAFARQWVTRPTPQ